MIIIHNSALAIDRFIANSENEQTSNELADVVHGVVAGTESADILMTILMVFSSGSTISVLIRWLT